MSGSGIEDLKIKPEAEQVTHPPSNVSGPQEVDFFKQGGEEYKLRHNQQNLGWLGAVFGQGSAASTNIAGLTVITCLIFVGVATLLEQTGLVDKAIAIITLALGYLFGAHQNRDKDSK